MRTEIPGTERMTVDEERARLQRKKSLDDEIRACRRCVGMNQEGVTQAAPGWGSIDSPVVIVGQSLCEQCMKPQEPFYEGSGSLLDAAFERAGCQKADMFITNAVHCHPPGNRRSHDHEIVNCSSYLYGELQIVRPRLVIGLGEDAERVLSFFYPSARKVPWPFVAPRNVRSRTVPCLHFAKHPSWVKRQHDATLEKTYVDSLAAAVTWALAKGSLRTQPIRQPERTCDGMVPTCAPSDVAPEER